MLSIQEQKRILSHMYKALCSISPHRIKSRRSQKTGKESSGDRETPTSSSNAKSFQTRRETNKQTKANEPEDGVSCTGDTMKNKKTGPSQELKASQSSSLEAQKIGPRDVGIGTPML
jgi:hypothetical protein